MSLIAAASHAGENPPSETSTAGLTPYSPRDPSRTRHLAGLRLPKAPAQAALTRAGKRGIAEGGKPPDRLSLARLQQ
jgi:hypothetical protein